MVKKKNTPFFYLAELEGTMLIRKRQILEDYLELLKKQPHDKVELKKQRESILKEIRELTFEINGKEAEVYKQNYQVVKYMLMMFVGMDFVTRLYDEAADMFKAVTVGIKRNELLDFVKLCREVATQANKVVCIIDEAGKDAMSMAYAGMEDGIGETMLSDLREKVESYSKSPEGKRFFFGYH